MPDTERYRRWLAMLAASDAVLLQLVTLAAAGVLAWEWIRRSPAGWRPRLRRAYLLFTAGVCLVTLAGQSFDVAGTIYFFVSLGLTVGAVLSVATVWRKASLARRENET
jgi:CDP-diglyceride synthetase